MKEEGGSYIIRTFIFIFTLLVVLTTSGCMEKSGSGQENSSIQNEPEENVVQNPINANDFLTAAWVEQDPEKKIEYYQNVINLDSNNISALWGISWTCYSDLNDVQSASEYLEKIILLQPRNTYFLDKKSFYLEEKGKKQDAIAIQDKIIEIVSDGEPFFVTEMGDQNGPCDKSSVLSQAWLAKMRLTDDLKSIKPYADIGNKYAEEWRKCAGWD